MRVITSKSNPSIKDLLSLHDKKIRDEKGLFLVEGYHLVEEAKKNNQLVEVWITDVLDDVYEVETSLVSYDIIKKISKTQQPQPIIGVCKKRSSNKIIGDQLLLLDDISDPGNLGTIIRSAAAFGISTIVLSPNCVDYTNDKVIRATQGALFISNIVIMEMNEAISYAKHHMIDVIGTSLEESRDVSSLDKVRRFALLLGNEARGVSKSLLDLCTIRVRLDMASAVESLNVAVAGSIFMFYLHQASKL